MAYPSRRTVLPVYQQCIGICTSEIIYVAKQTNIKNKRTQTIINSHRNAKRNFFLGDESYPPTKVPDILQ